MKQFGPYEYECPECEWTFDKRFSRKNDLPTRLERQCRTCGEMQEFKIVGVEEPYYDG